MATQKFHWYESAKQLPENSQDHIFVSYIGKCGNGERRFFAETLCNSANVRDGKLYFGTDVCDYWSPCPSLPKNAPLRNVETMPAIYPTLRD